MKNVGIVMDITSKSGGKLHMAISICKYLLKNKNYNFIYITTFNDAKKLLDNELKINTKLFDKSSYKIRFLNKLKRLINFLPFKTPFQKFIKKNKIDILYFLDPSPMVKNFDNTKFIYSIFDIEHRELNKLTEFSKEIALQRDVDYQHACKNCSCLIVGTKKLKEEVSKIYEIEKHKVFNVIFPPPIITANKGCDVNILKKINNPQIKFNYLLYPAQFWSHKNHKYIIEAVSYLKTKNNFDMKVIFTGHDKGNLSNIKSLISQKQIEDNFIFFDYVKNEDLFQLYENCAAVIIPTLVAPHTFPLYEAFFFRKPVIYNTKVLDESLKDKVISLNVDKIDDLDSALKKINDKDRIKKMTDLNYKYFQDIFGDNILEQKLNDILKKALTN